MLSLRSIFLKISKYLKATVRGPLSLVLITRGLSLGLCLSLSLGAVSVAYAADDTSTDLTVIARNLKASSEQDKNAPIKVCAVPQLYAALSTLQGKTKIDFVPRFATNNELYALLSNTNTEQLPQLCDLLLSADERLPISLVRTNRALASSLVPFTRAPLVLWSADPELLSGHDPRTLLNKRQIKSIAIAQRELTPVGYATNQVIKNHLDLSSLRNQTYKASHEYQVYSMVSSGNVSCGFISMPLIVDTKQQIQGSYWLVPRRMHSDIQYYGVLLSPSVTNKDAQEFLRYLVEEPEAQKHFSQFGFSSIKSDI